MFLNAPLNRKLRMGLVGGGRGSFIGRVHGLAATLDRRAELVAGALSADPVKAKESAADYGIAPERAYGSFQEMAQAEASLPESERIDFVTVATPNHTHFEIAKTFAEAGFNVMCDKPMTLDLAQARELTRVVEQTGVVFAVTHNYTGYPLVREAREMIRAGELGEIQAVRACYLQGWLRRQRTPEQQRRVAWKTDPLRTGLSGCFGDIGIHAYNLCRFITALLPQSISCSLKIFEPDGKLDDYGTAVLRFGNGALGTITASRISHGRENDLWIEIDGTNGSLEWRQEEPNRMFVRGNGQPLRLHTRASSTSNLAWCRLPSGHPEGFLEAFANIYTAAYEDMIARASGRTFNRLKALYPNVDDGLDGMGFISQCVASAQSNGAWQCFPPPEGPQKEKELPMIEEVHPSVDNTVLPADDGARPPESSVRGILQGAIQKVMDEIDHHEQEARRHLQQAEDLRRELQEGFRIVKQEARASAKAAARSEPGDDAGVSEETKDPSATARPPRGESKKKPGGRGAKK